MVDEEEGVGGGGGGGDDDDVEVAPASKSNIREEEELNDDDTKNDQTKHDDDVVVNNATKEPGTEDGQPLVTLVVAAEEKKEDSEPDNDGNDDGKDGIPAQTPSIENDDKNRNATIESNNDDGEPLTVAASTSTAEEEIYPEPDDGDGIDDVKVKDIAAPPNDVADNASVESNSDEQQPLHQPAGAAAGVGSKPEDDAVNDVKEEEIPVPTTLENDNDNNVAEPNTDVEQPLPLLTASAQVDPEPDIGDGDRSDEEIEKKSFAFAPSAEHDNDNDAGDDALLLPTIFKDHFTLPYPSSVVRFRSNKTATRVFENRSSQFVLEETLEPERKIRVKLLNESTKNLQFLRAAYCIVAIFWTGILFVFCLQVLLAMTLEVAVQYGTTQLNTKFNFLGFIGTLLALFQFCVGFAHGMVIATAFVMDVWDGHSLIKRTFATKRLNETFIDWAFFCSFILFPALVFCITIYAGYQNWWTITALFWFSCIGLFYVIFAFSSIYFEIKSALDFVSEQDRSGLDKIFEASKQCAYLKLIHTYSGVRKTKYFAHSRKSVYQLLEDGKETIIEGVVEDSRQEKYGCCTCITRWGCVKRGDRSENDDSGWFPIFKHLDPPRRIFLIDDFQDYRPFITKNTWGLERLYCRPRNSRYVAIVNGPGAVTKDQMMSSIVCSFIAIVLYLLMLIAVLVYFGISAFLITVIAIIYLILMYSAIKDNVALIKLVAIYMENDVSKDDNTDEQSNLDLASNEGVNEAIHLVTEYRRVTEPTDGFCWAMMVLRLLIFFLFPAVILFMADNNFVALMFLVIASISNLRYYIDIVVIIEETRNMEHVRGRTVLDRWDEQSWESQSRLSGVIQAISYDKSKKVWLVIMAGFGVVLFAILTGAVGGGNQEDQTSSDRLDLIPVSEFYYPPQPIDVRYQTCNLSRDLFGENATLADFAFMSIISYHSQDNIVDELNEWFGEGVVVSERDTVDQFFSGSEFEGNLVSFQLFNFTQMGKGVISIRGTQSPWDLLSDSQLWSTAMLCQVLRLLLPLGEIWTPLLDEIVQAINTLQSGSLKRIAYYKATTAFANDLKDANVYQYLQLTGHSLGGGLAIISGAQTSLPAVALSGPNARLSGSSFTPKVTHEQLDQYTFNIVPAMDPVARFDDIATQYQNIRCLADPSKFMECHFSTRSLCEILYTCGSGNRPLYCKCVSDLKYPKPLSHPGARDFDDVCPPATNESS